LRPYTRTSFHHQPEAQHPKIFSYPQAAGRLPHLSGAKQTRQRATGATLRHLSSMGDSKC
ncbi:MAG: hypothetical protein WB495_20845, partial [Xanthobacteraceae bacterium]